MLVHNFKTKEICALLDVSDSFVSKWKVIYENEGAEGLRVNCPWAASARPKGARPVVQTTGFQPPSLPVGGLARR
ncbi:MAG: helix-turn-helix domain-containing protein [Candidatus Competibacteraceae bacterium]|nr:helix-turn-helix domain-containing protein [Candidatus Competibacteraceae bacterium]